MTFPGLTRSLTRPVAYAVAVAAALLAPALAAAPGVESALPAFSAFAPLPPADIGEAPRLQIAQSRGEAQLALQIQQLQEQIRSLTGQVEGLQFQLTQMQTLIERMTEDNEFRFQQLEGGAGKKPEAATQPGGVTQPEVLPQTPAETAPAPAPADPAAGAPMDDLGEPMHDPAPGEPMDNLAVGESADPLVGTNGAGADDTLGTLSPEDLTLRGSRPLDLTLDGGAVSNGDANAQYAAGYDAIVRGDYAFAEDQFAQFIALYPDDPQAPDATNWLGEALMQRGAFEDAALVLAEGYQKYQATPRAPDLMLKLGMALNGAGEREVACRTFATLEQRFTDLPAAFVQRLGEEKSRAQCPA